MRVLIVSPGQDTGGMGIRIKNAFDKHSTTVQVRALRSSENFIEYPADLETYKLPRSVVERHWQEADVIHCSNSMEGVRRYGGSKLKPSVLTHQGTAFRTAPQVFLREAKHFRAIQTASTIDLTTLAPAGVVRWSPHPVPIEMYQELRAAAERPERVVVHHSPTNRKVKSTALFLEAMERLMAEDPRVKLQLVEGKPWMQNVKLKARADIVYDQLILGWGTNALEAWAMGIPVIAATEFPRVRAAMVDHIGPELPPYEATADTLYDALRTLVNEPDLRLMYGLRGLDYVRRFHAEEVVVNRLTGLYAEAIEYFSEAAA